jgi:hypothetical protein
MKKVSKNNKGRIRMKDEKIIFIIGLLFLSFSTAFVFAEGISGSGSNANTLPGVKAKPSQVKVRDGSGGIPHKPKSTNMDTGDEAGPLREVYTRKQ